MKRIFSIIPKIFSPKGLLVILILFVLTILLYFFLWKDEISRLIWISFGILSFIIFIVIVTFYFEQDTDKALDRLRNISTVSLLGLAILGYFYTVNPTYENKILNRKKVELEDSLSILNHGIDRLNNEAIVLRSDMASLKLEKNKILKELSYNKQQQKKFEEKSIHFAKQIYLQNLGVRFNLAMGIPNLPKPELYENIYWNFKLYNEDSQGMRLKNEDYKDMLISLLKTFINYSRHINSGISAADSLLSYFAKNTIYLLEKNKSRLFNYTKQINKIKEDIELYNRLIKECQTDECYKQIEELPSDIFKETRKILDLAIFDFIEFINNKL